jgi:NAD(P)-dependent dehydrogenase (short-subunit alcohol dehydrogenase family)
MEIKGRAALITGGARIGATVAGALARRGCDVALTYRNSKSSAESSAAAAEKLGVRSLALRADLSDEAGCRRAVSGVEKGLGRLDILVHMASLYRKTPMESVTSEFWEEQLTTDLRSAYWTAAGAAPAMKRAGTGRVVLFSDWTAASGRPRYKGFSPYYVAKQGIIGLVEDLALEWAPEILVNAVAPGPILKPEGLSDKEDEEVIRATPLGRWGGPEEIAKAVVFLIESDFVTGETIRVDGGRHLR